MIMKDGLFNKILYIVKMFINIEKNLVFNNNKVQNSYETYLI
jgi:hypothetical protein